MIETIIIISGRDSSGNISDAPAQCSGCGTWVEPEKQERLYKCPECDYEGEIEDWY